jgi:flagellar L-ring protein FlgH
MRHPSLALALVAALALAVPARAQDPPAEPAAEPAADAVAAPADSAPAAPAPPVRSLRASWLGDRRTLAVGDLLTIVVDEQTEAREKVSNTAVGDRAQKAALNASGVSPDNIVGPTKEFQTGLTSSSRQIGEAGRSGGLTAMLTVRVTAIEPGGLARVEGQKSVTVDGRLQQVTLRGLVRPQDVLSQNRVPSSRIADAVITYKGKKIAPKTGLLGSILNMLWP